MDEIIDSFTNKKITIEWTDWHGSKKKLPGPEERTKSLINFYPSKEITVNNNGNPWPVKGDGSFNIEVWEPNDLVNIDKKENCEVLEHGYGKWKIIPYALESGVYFFSLTISAKKGKKNPNGINDDTGGGPIATVTIGEP